MTKLADRLLDNSQLSHELESLSVTNDAVSSHVYISNDGSIHLQLIKVSKSAPPGTGTDFMEKLTKLADEFGRVITLKTGEAERNTGKWKATTSGSRLREFYRRFGFIMNSKSGRYDLKGNMHRLPR